MAIKMYITDRDKKVLRFVEKYGSITISQAQKMFFNTQVYGYDIARRRLRRMVEYKKLKVMRDFTGNENVYYIDKKLSYHDLLALDYYAELVYSGANIIYFKRNQNWLDGKYVSDAYCCYIIGNKVFFNILEVVRTKGVDKEKYIELYNSGEPQIFNSLIYEKLGGSSINEFPRLIIVDNKVYKDDMYIHENIRVDYLDFDMRDFTKIFV